MSGQEKKERKIKNNKIIKKIGKSVWAVGCEIALCNYDMNKD